MTFCFSSEVLIYEGDPRRNANTSVISSTFGISKNGLHVYYDIDSLRFDFFYIYIT